MTVQKQDPMMFCVGLFTFYKMVTGDIMPRHADHFMTYQKIFNVDKSKVWRAVIVLQDWEPGHYFDIENEAIVN